MYLLIGYIQSKDFVFNSFLESVDLIIMERKTFEQVKSFDNCSYKDNKMIVLTSKDIKSLSQNYFSMDNDTTRELYQSKIVLSLLLISGKQLSKSIIP
jgi:dihydrofolate reductase